MANDVPAAPNARRARQALTAILFSLGRATIHALPSTACRAAVGHCLKNTACEQVARRWRAGCFESLYSPGLGMGETQAEARTPTSVRIKNAPGKAESQGGEGHRTFPGAIGWLAVEPPSARGLGRLPRPARLNSKRVRFGIRACGSALRGPQEQVRYNMFPMQDLDARETLRFPFAVHP